jgi:hypothetical protein
MIHVDAHSHFGTFDAPNDEKQALLALGLTALMAVVTVVLIVAAVLSPAA